MLFTSMPEHKEANKANKEPKDSHDIDDNNNFFCKKYLNDTQPRVTKVWNCNEIGFDPNVKWNKFICTYKFF